MTNVFAMQPMSNAVNNNHLQRQAVLRLTTQLLGCPYAALISLAPDGLLQETVRIGYAPLDVVQPAMLPNIEEESPPTILSGKANGATWSLAGVRLRHTTPLNGGVKEFLVVGSPPNDPLDVIDLTPLLDLAICMGPPLSELEHNGGQSHARLPDRTAFGLYLEALLKQQQKKEKNTAFGILRIELDHLAQINERHGWDTADLMIDAMIERVLASLPAEAYLSHFGGGNIAVITPPGMSLVNTRTLVNAVLKSMHGPVTLDAGPLGLSVSIGWAMYPIDGRQSEELMIAARAALAEASRTGGGHDHRADELLSKRFQDASGLEHDLLRAISTEALSLHWMPIVSTGSQHVVALEALLRWNRPGHGDVSPDLFIRCAEEAGMIEQLDAWSLRAACRAAQEWSSPLRLCVNISPAWLVNERLALLVSAVLAETGLAPQRLQIELSERRPFGPRTLAHQELSRLRALGVRVALDDFGAGYSSLERLGTFPVDQIKLDRAFVTRLGDDPRVDNILRGMLQMVMTLGIECCAKGVETEHQMAFLDAYGCEEVQGYLLGEPVAEYTSLQKLPL